MSVKIYDLTFNFFEKSIWQASVTNVQVKTQFQLRVRECHIYDVEFQKLFILKINLLQQKVVKI